MVSPEMERYLVRRIRQLHAEGMSKSDIIQQLKAVAGNGNQASANKVDVLYEMQINHPQHAIEVRA
jgi:hypothetical protein